VVAEQISAIGGLLAVVYVGTIGSILWWMLHIPQVGGIEQQVGRIQREAARFARIIVPIQGDVVSDRVVALASQMSKYRGAVMDVVYVIEVPMHLPIDAVTADQLQHAEGAFAKAAKIASRYDVRINRHIQRARQAGPSIVEYAREHSADFILMGDVPKSNRRGTRFARSVEFVFENAPCEVIIDRPPME